jgi:tRNA A-37 threonylcarbamoyl transferase component Bud32
LTAIIRIAGVNVGDPLFPVTSTQDALLPMPLMRFTMDDWLVHTPDRFARGLPWSTLSRLELGESHLRGIARDWLAHVGYHVLKSDRSSLVEARQLEIDHKPVDLVSKSPWVGTGIKGWLRSYRHARVLRAMQKTLRLQAVGVACEYPLLAMERRKHGRLLEQLFVAERVPGNTLSSFKLDSMSEIPRRDLFIACGQAIAVIESKGWTHFDTKTTNWIVFQDGPRYTPVMIDCDGMRTYPWRGAGIERLTRSLRQHPQHRSTDLDALSEGYRG